MTRLIISGLIASFAMPGMALAQAEDVASQGASQTVIVEGSVPKACVLSSPGQATLPIGALTDGTGRLKPTLASTTVAVQTSFDDAWCNTKSTLTLTASPLTLTVTPPYASPAGFSRRVTYTAKLANWAVPVSLRPVQDDEQDTFDATGAHAALPLLLEISELAPLSGTSEAPTNFIEAGQYSANVVVTLAVAN